MLDRLKVIKGLEEAVRVIEDYVPECYRGYSRLSCYDAIAMLREPEPVKPIKKLGIVEAFKCGACKWVLGWATGFPLYCPRCGKKVDWDA
jgi:hypothetical protein